MWSGYNYMRWEGGKPGDKLGVAIPVKEGGQYKLSLQLIKSPDYGIVQLYLDGKKLVTPIDLYDSSLTPTGALDMGVHQLSQGQNRLNFEVMVANEKGSKKYFFGLDYVKLEAVK